MPEAGERYTLCFYFLYLSDLLVKGVWIILELLRLEFLLFVSLNFELEES
jgi:hypothetical protein